LNQFTSNDVDRYHLAF